MGVLTRSTVMARRVAAIESAVIVLGSTVLFPKIVSGTGLVGDFTKAMLFDRQSVSVGTINDMFVRNQVAVLAELRATFAVVRPTAFCIISGA
jgi:HK97 family phage major capsid protein